MLTKNTQQKKRKITRDASFFSSFMSAKKLRLFSQGMRFPRRFEKHVFHAGQCATYCFPPLKAATQMFPNDRIFPYVPFEVALVLGCRKRLAKHHGQYGVFG